MDMGLVKSIGVSNFSPEKIQKLLETARIRPAVNQVNTWCRLCLQCLSAAAEAACQFGCKLVSNLTVKISYHLCDTIGMTGEDAFLL